MEARDLFFFSLHTLFFFFFFATGVVTVRCLMLQVPECLRVMAELDSEASQTVFTACQHVSLSDERELICWACSMGLMGIPSIFHTIQHLFVLQWSSSWKIFYVNSLTCCFLDLLLGFRMNVGIFKQIALRLISECPETVFFEVN